MSTEQPSREPVVLRAKPAPKWPGFLLLVQLWVPLAVGAVYVWGLSGLVKLTALVMAAGAYYLFMRRFVPDELTFDEEGVVVHSARKGFLARTPVRFRWEEVEAVRKIRQFSRNLLAITVGRGRIVWLRPGHWQDDRFVESVRRHVSPEKILPGALEPGAVAPWVTVLCGGFLLACFVALAVTSVLFVSEPKCSALVAAMVAMACCALAGFAWLSALDEPSAVGTMVAGGLFAMPLLSSLLILLGLLGATDMRTALGGLGGTAGLLLGAAVLTFLAPRARRPHVALFYYLGLAGCAVGALGWDGIPSQRLGESTFLFQAWTPSGDGFVVAKVDRAGEGSVAQWYSADGTPERRVPVPAVDAGCVQAVGQDAALYRVRHETEEDLFLVPRFAGGYRLVATRTDVLGVRVSPNGQRCVFVTQADDEAPRFLNYLELPDGEGTRISLPAGHEEAESIGMLDDSHLVWVTGERPKDLQGQELSYDSELPRADVWKPTHEPVKVWAWDPEGGESPKLLYAEEHICLDWRMPTNSSALYLCRIADGGTLRKEFVEIALDDEHPQARPCLPSRLGWFDSASADGRFAVKTYEGSFPHRTYVRDTVTGKPRRLRDQGRWTGPFLWSPTGNRFLYETTHYPFELVWQTDLGDRDPHHVIRLVDLEE